MALFTSRKCAYIGHRFMLNSTSIFNNVRSQQKKRITSVPLSQPLPGLDNLMPNVSSPLDSTSTCSVTTVNSGIQVASVPAVGSMCTVGVLLKSGSRYETGHLSGTTHFLEKLAYGTTSKFKSRDAILQLLDKYGGICDCQGSRDTLIYASSINASGLSDVMELLSETVCHAELSEEEIDIARHAVQFELESIEMNPNPEQILMELIHAASYRDNTLGLPKLCPLETISRITRNDLLSYIKAHHTPERIVLAGVGVDHEQFLHLTEKFFPPKEWWRDELSLSETLPNLGSSQYTGGVMQIEKDLSNVSVGPNPMPHLAHVAIALESSSHQDKDFVAFCVLNMMLGGGGSFSAGGPGKGMYTRLYTNVLNRYHWIFSATAFNHAYQDSGIFCITASAHPNRLKDLVHIIATELANTVAGCEKVELERAKRQLQSMLLMNLESRPVAFEDLGRQVLASGKRHDAQYYYSLIGLKPKH